MPFTDYKDLKREKEANGAFAISFEALNTERNKLAYPHINEETIIEDNGHEYRIKQLSESRFRKSITALHVFFDLRGKPIEETKGGTITIKEAFDFLLKDTGWTYEIKGNFEPELVPNFGNDNVLALIWVACEAFEADIDIQKNKHLVVGNNLGKDDDFQYRYKHNVKTLKRDVDTSNFGTRIIGRGTDGLKVEYISPLEEEYRKNNPDFEPIYAEEVKDDRIKHEDTMLKKLKRTLQDVPEINLEVETAVLGEDRNVHDNVWLIYEPLGIEFKTTVIKKTEYPKAPHKNKVELGDKKQSFSDLMTEQNIKIDENNKEVHSRIDQTNDRISLEVETINESISSLVVEQNNITLRVENFERETSAQFEVMAERISSRVTSEEAESIFEQKADSFTFSANQINFDGEVFGNSNARFEGQVRAERLIGDLISGIKVETNSRYGKHIRMEEQQLQFIENGTVKMRIGFRDGNYYEPFFELGKGKSDGTSKFYVDKNEDDITLSYSTSRGLSSYKMNHNGSVSIVATNTLNLSSQYTIQSNAAIRAPDFINTSRSAGVKAHDGLEKINKLTIVETEDEEGNIKTFAHQPKLRGLTVATEEEEGISLMSLIYTNSLAIQELDDKLTKLLEGE